MCLLTYFPPDTLPDTEKLKQGAQFNDDGHGFAIVTPMELKVFHSLNAAETIETFELARKIYPEGPALFHSRYTTHGKTNVKNCHPFFVGNDPRIVVAHNGILPKEVQPKGKDKRSDTAIFARRFLPKNYPLQTLDTKNGRERLERWLTPFNKIVILSTHPKLKYSGYIFNEDEGIWDEGIWYSNDNYLPYNTKFVASTFYAKYGKYYGKYTESYQSDDQCDFCGTIGSLDYVVAICKWCHTCLDCKMGTANCQCYQGNEAKVLGLPKECILCDGYTVVGNYCTECQVCMECLNPDSDCDCK